jgi:hypothetical protein
MCWVLSSSGNLYTNREIRKRKCPVWENYPQTGIMVEERWMSENTDITEIVASVLSVGWKSA